MKIDPKSIKNDHAIRFIKFILSEPADCRYVLHVGGNIIVHDPHILYGHIVTYQHDDKDILNGLWSFYGRYVHNGASYSVVINQDFIQSISEFYAPSVM